MHKVWVLIKGLKNNNEWGVFIGKSCFLSDLST